MALLLKIQAGDIDADVQKGIGAQRNSVQHQMRPRDLARIGQEHALKLCGAHVSCSPDQQTDGQNESDPAQKHCSHARFLEINGR
jgi:hypothetical protein